MSSIHITLLIIGATCVLATAGGLLYRWRRWDFSEPDGFIPLFLGSVFFPVTWAYGIACVVAHLLTPKTFKCHCGRCGKRIAKRAAD